MASFKFAWVISMLGLALLSGALLWLDAEAKGILGLSHSASLVLVVWVIGLVSTGLIVIYERGVRIRLLRSARRETELESTRRIAEIAAQELAQPLTVVMAYAQWLQRGVANPKDHRHYLQQMTISCHEMSVILRNLYETIRHSRAQAGLTILDEPPIEQAQQSESTTDEDVRTEPVPGFHDLRVERPLGAERRHGATLVG